jgi:transcriptional regulator of arginine metabolism
MAMAVAAAVDNLEVPGVVGSIAGDDTVMCAIRTAKEVESVMRKLNKLVHAKE